MLDITPEQLKILESMVKAPNKWQPLAELRASRVDMDEMWEAGYVRRRIRDHNKPLTDANILYKVN